MATGTPDLPIHFRTGLRAVGIVAGRPVWPICGGDESEGAAAQAAAKVAADAAQAVQVAQAAANADKGFPENTPLEQMTAAQQAGYWKHQSRRHEDRNKAFGGLTLDQLTELRGKAEQHDALEAELASDKDKAVATAEKSAKDASRSEYLPQVINANLDAAAARAGVTAEQLASAVEFVNHAKFLDQSGGIDAAKVSSFIAGITPATGNQQHPKGPVMFAHPAGAPPSTPGDQGRAMAEKRFGKKQQQ